MPAGDGRSVDSRGGLRERGEALAWDGGLAWDGQIVAPEDLPPGYYAENFRRVLDVVAERYDDLLSPEETALRGALLAASDDARRLYVRLVSRKGPLFRRDRLRYDEIDDLDAAVDELIAAGLLDRAETSTVDALLRLLVRGELAELAAEHLELPRGARSLRRGDLVTALVEGLEPDRLRAVVHARLDVLRPLGAEQILVYRLLFFGNLEQDWTALLLRDLGVVRYEPYALEREQRLFPDRRAVDETLSARAARLALRALMARGEDDEALALGRRVLERAASTHPIARPHVDRVLAKVGRMLERRGEPEAALELYVASTSARERRCRVLEKLGRFDEALALCRTMADDPLDEIERDAAPKIEHRLRRALGETPSPRRRRRRPIEELELERDDDGDEDLCIERRVLAHFESEGRAGLWSENWLWRTLFGLAFWDVVFAPVRGAFEHPFQLGPLDFDGPGFRAARRALVDERLDAIRRGDHHLDALLATADAKRGTANRLVPWHEELDDALRFALERVDGPTLAAVCDRFARDPGRHRRGLPDLFVDVPPVDDSSEPGFMLYEVKGPGDQLRPEQKGWIDYLVDRDIPVRVLKVRWREPQ